MAVVAALLGVALSGGGASAQGERTVTLEEAIEQALVKSPALAQSEASLTNARSARRRGMGSFIPSLSASTSASRSSSQRFDAGTQRLVSGSSSSYSAGISGSYQIFDGGRRFIDVTRNRASIRAAVARLEDQRFSVTLQTKQLYVAALRQAELLEVTQEQQTEAEKNLELVRARFEAGEGTTADTLQAVFQLMQAQLSVLSTERGLRTARFSLGRQIGDSGPVAPAPLAEAFDPRPLGLPDEDILAEAERNAPSVRAAGAETEASKAALRAERTSYLPSISMSSGYNWSNTEPTFSGANTSWSLRFSGSYQIFNGFTRSVSISQAEVSSRIARLQEENARLVAREQADAALQNLKTAEVALEISRQAQVVAEENLRVTQERYELEVAIFLELLTAQISLAQARVDLISGRYDYIVARWELEAILGREL